MLLYNYGARKLLFLQDTCPLTSGHITMVHVSRKPELLRTTIIAPETNLYYRFIYRMTKYLAKVQTYNCEEGTYL